MRVLKQGCERYRQAMKDTSGIDPFVEAVTGASSVHLAYRKDFVQQDSIAVVSDHGLQPETHTSAKANAWFAWLMKQCDGRIQIQCALNGKEKKVGKYRLDGFVEIPSWSQMRIPGYPFHTGKIDLEFNGVSFDWFWF